MKKERRDRLCRSSVRIVAIAGVIVFTVSAVFGAPSYTTANSSLSRAQILSGLYGGNFTSRSDPLGGSRNYRSTNGVLATRIYDSDSSSNNKINLTSSDSDVMSNVDQIWTTANTETMTISVKGDPTSDISFGWNGGETGTTTYNELLTPTSQEVLLTVTGDFLFGFQSNGQKLWSSDTADSMITYKITELPEQITKKENVWVIFINSSSTNKDYNDFVVEVTAAPEPATMALFALGGLLLRKRS